MGDLSILSKEMRELSESYWSCQVLYCDDFDGSRPLSARVPYLDLTKLEGVCLDITLSPQNNIRSESRGEILNESDVGGSNRTLEML